MLTSTVVFLTFVACVVVNAGVAKDIGDISRRYQTVITPASYAFSIWGVIYTCLSLFVLFQMFLACKYRHVRVLACRKDREATDKEDDNLLLVFETLFHETYALGGFVLTNILNACWIVAFSFAKGTMLMAANVIIWLLLLVLFVVNVQLSRKRANLNKLWVRVARFFLTELPFSIYFGWVLCASILGVALTPVLFDSYQGPDARTTELYFSFGCLVATLFLQLAMLICPFRCCLYGVPQFVYLWATVAISNQLSPENFGLLNQRENLLHEPPEMLFTKEQIAKWNGVPLACGIVVACSTVLALAVQKCLQIRRRRRMQN